MDIKIDDNSMATIAATAIFKEMTQETRDSVIQQAIKYLLTPEKSQYNYGSPSRTPLQEAFEQAIRNAAFSAVENAVRNDPVVKEHIQNLLGPLIMSTIEAESANYGDTLASAVGEALGIWLATRGSRKE